MSYAQTMHTYHQRLEKQHAYIPGVGTPHTWVWFGRSAVMTPILGVFNPIGSLFYTSI